MRDTHLQSCSKEQNWDDHIPKERAKNITLASKGSKTWHVLARIFLPTTLTHPRDPFLSQFCNAREKVDSRNVMSVVRAQVWRIPSLPNSSAAVGRSRISAERRESRAEQSEREREKGLWEANRKYGHFMDAYLAQDPSTTEARLCATEPIKQAGLIYCERLRKTRWLSNLDDREASRAEF